MLVFAPRHDVFSGEPSVATHDDLHLLTESLADGGNDFSQRFHRTLGSIAITGTQLGPKRNVSAKAVERKVAVVAVVTVVKTTFLLAVNGVVSGIKVQHDLAALAWDRFDSQLNKQSGNGFSISRDFFVFAGCSARGKLQPVECGFSGQRFALVFLGAIRPEHILLMANQCE
jgi:hypothetical protein